MKKFLLSLTLFTALLGVSNLSLAQCASGGPCNLALSGLTLSITSVEKDANGNCTSLKGTLTFFIDDNNGNKAVYINLWDQVNYAAGAGEFNWCTKNAKGPTLSQINGTQNNSGPIGIIGIRNEAPFSFLQTYSPDPTNINITNKKLLQGTTIQVEPAPTPELANRKKFILNDVIIPISGCEFSIQGNIWGTNAGSAAPSLQCYDDNFSFSVGSVEINDAMFNCAKIPREFQVFLDATGTVPVSYQIYIDDNGNGIVDAGEVVVYTSGQFTISDVNGSAPDYSSGFVAINEPYASQTEVFRKDLLLRVSYFNALTNSTIVLPAYELNNGCATLPVSYKSFSATRSNNNQVVLEWETAMEENNKGFHVQRNIDGSWKNIGFVFSQANGGNSSEALKYAFKDANNSKGISQYRILQVDIDGKGKYSQIRSVHGLETAARVVLFPNPSHTGSFNLLFEDATSVRDVMVSDVSGRVVKQFKGVSGSTLIVDGLIDGFYTVQVANRTSGTASVEKVIIKKR